MSEGHTAPNYCSTDGRRHAGSEVNHWVVLSMNPEQRRSRGERGGRKDGGEEEEEEGCVRWDGGIDSRLNFQVLPTLAFSLGAPELASAAASVRTASRLS